MTDPKFTIGSLWKTRGGGKAIVVEHNSTDLVAYHCNDGALKKHDENGFWLTDKRHAYDLLTPWVEPNTVRVHWWVNVYKDDSIGSIFSSRADAAGDNRRIACKELDFTVVEGEGL